VSGALAVVFLPFLSNLTT